MCEKRQNADSDTIAVTPEMIEAGLQTYWESGAAETPNAGADRELMRSIYQAMSQARSESPQ
jgi:hypothetical protein